MRSGRIVVVTGAAGGIGSLLVERFLANGDVVVASDWSAEALECAAVAWDGGDRLVVVHGDISDERDCARVAQAAADGFGRVDVLVNCAGHFPRQHFEGITPQDWRRVIDLNLTGSFLMTRAVLPLMKGRGWGRIISYASGTVFAGTPGQAHYVAAKAGVIGLTRCLASELGEHGITANAITPGLTLTAPVRRDYPPAVLAGAVERRSIRRNMLPEDLVGTTFFLASPDADFMTGQTVNVDGGSTKH